MYVVGLGPRLLSEDYFASFLSVEKQVQDKIRDKNNVLFTTSHDLFFTAISF